MSKKSFAGFYIFLKEKFRPTDPSDRITQVKSFNRKAFYCKFQNNVNFSNPIF